MGMCAPPVTWTPRNAPSSTKKTTSPSVSPLNLMMRGAMTAQRKRATITDVSKSIDQSASTTTPTIGMPTIKTATTIPARVSRISGVR